MAGLGKADTTWPQKADKAKRKGGSHVSCATIDHIVLWSLQQLGYRQRIETPSHFLLHQEDASPYMFDTQTI